MGKNIRYCAALAAITAMVSLSGCGGTDDGTERGTQSPAAEETSGGAGDATEVRRQVRRLMKPVSRRRPK